MGALLVDHRLCLADLLSPVECGYATGRYIINLKRFKLVIVMCQDKSLRQMVHYYQALVGCECVSPMRTDFISVLTTSTNLW